MTNSERRRSCDEERDENLRLKQKLRLLPSRLLDRVDVAKVQLTVLSVFGLVTFFCIVLASSGARVERNPVTLWNNDVLRGSKFLENDLGITERQSDVSIIQYFESLREEDASAHDNVSSMLTRPELLRHHNLVKRLLQTKVTLDKSQWEVSDICVKLPFPLYDSEKTVHHIVNNFLHKMNPCVISTPLDCFWDGASLLDETCQELAVAGDPRDKLRWRNNDVRKNVSKLREIYKSNTDMFDFVDGVLNQYGIGDIPYLSKPCLDTDNCEQHASEVQSDDEVTDAFSRYNSIGAIGSAAASCPSFATKFLNSSFEITLGGISRSFDGRISSAQQLHTVMYIMNKRQLFAAGSERAKLYHMAWNEDVAEKLLILFHNKFQKIVDSFNAIKANYRKSSSNNLSQPRSKFMLFSMRQNANDFVALLEDYQLIVLTCLSLGLLAVLLLTEKFILNSKEPVATSMSLHVVSLLTVGCVTLVPMVVKSDKISFSVEHFQVVVVMALPIVYGAVMTERLLADECVSTWRSCLSWPVLYSSLSILVPTLIFFTIYAMQVCRSVSVCMAILVVLLPFICIFVARPLRLSSIMAARKYRAYRSAKAAQQSNLLSAVGLNLEPKEDYASHKSDKDYSAISLKKRPSNDVTESLLSSHNKSGSNDATNELKLKEDASGNHPKTNSVMSDSPPSSHGNKVSLYELGIPQSYIRPHCSKRRRRHGHSSRHSHHRRSSTHWHSAGGGGAGINNAAANSSAPKVDENRDSRLSCRVYNIVGVNDYVPAPGEKIEENQATEVPGSEDGGGANESCVDYEEVLEDEAAEKTGKLTIGGAQKRRDANAEHRSEPASSSTPPSSPRDYRNPTSSGPLPRRESSSRNEGTKRKLGASASTSRGHRRFHVGGSSSSSSACCRYYYGQYCGHNARWSRTWRKRRIRKQRMKRRRSLEVINSMAFNLIMRCFNLLASKQCQITVACLCVVCCVLSCYVLPNAQTGLEDETDLINRNSVFYSFVHMVKTNFRIPMTISVAVYSKDVDLKDPKIQRSLVNLDNDVREIDIIDPSSDHMFCWLKRFRRFLSHLQAAGKLKNYENMTSEVEMARVLMTQQDNGHYKRLDSQRDLVNADGEISQIAFMSLLTAWFNWDIKGVFDTQPGFEPPPPPMPPFSDRVKYVTTSGPISVSYFHYKLSAHSPASMSPGHHHQFSRHHGPNGVVESREDALRVSISEQLFRICERYSQGGLKVFPTGVLVFPWSQLHDVTLVLLCVSTVTVLTLPTVYYFLFRRTRLSFTMLFLYAGQMLVTIGVCVCANVQLSPLCLLVVTCLFTVSAAMSSVVIAYPFTTTDNELIVDLLQVAGNFYCRVFVIVFISSLTQALSASLLYFSAYNLLSNHVLWCVLVSSGVSFATFVLVVPALTSRMSSYCVKLARRASECRTSSHNMLSYTQSASSDQSWYWFPYSAPGSPWQGGGMGGGGGGSWYHRRHRHCSSGASPPRPPHPDDPRGLLLNSSSNSFVMGGGAGIPGSGHGLQNGRNESSNGIYPMQMTTKRLSFLSGQGTLTRRQRMRLQRSYIRNQQFLSMALAGQTSSRNSVSNASCSPRLQQQHSHSSHTRFHHGLARSISASSQQIDPILPSRNLLSRNVSSGGSTMVPTGTGAIGPPPPLSPRLNRVPTLAPPLIHEPPSTCSTERKMFALPQQHTEEEHECCLPGHQQTRYPLLLGATGGAEDTISGCIDERSVSGGSSFYPYSVTDAESDFLLMRSPSQTIEEPTRHSNSHDHNNSSCCNDLNTDINIDT